MSVVPFRLRDVGALVRLTVLAATIEAALRWWRLPPLAARLGLSIASGPEPAVRPFDAAVLTPAEAHRLDLAAKVLRRGPFSNTCLRKALLFGHELRARTPEVVLGVRSSGGEVRAHAWLQIGDQTLEPDSVERFQVLRAVDGGTR